MSMGATERSTRRCFLSGSLGAPSPPLPSRTSREAPLGAQASRPQWAEGPQLFKRTGRLRSREVGPERRATLPGSASPAQRGFFR